MFFEKTAEIKVALKIFLNAVIKDRNVDWVCQENRFFPCSTSHLHQADDFFESQMVFVLLDTL